MLLSIGANIYAVDNRKWTALHYAAYWNHIKTIKILCTADSDYERLK